MLLYDAAIEEGKQLQACYRGKGIALMQKMEYQSAIEAFQTALESANFIEKHFYKDHMEQDIRKYLASCYIHNGQPGDAILIYNALIDKDDENVYLYMERGTAKAAQGDLESAKADFDKAINLDRGNYERILEIAQTLERKREWDTFQASRLRTTASTRSSREGSSIIWRTTRGRMLS